MTNLENAARNLVNMSTVDFDKNLQGDWKVFVHEGVKKLMLETEDGFEIGIRIDGCEVSLIVLSKPDILSRFFVTDVNLGYVYQTPSGGPEDLLIPKLEKVGVDPVSASEAAKLYSLMVFTVASSL